MTKEEFLKLDYGNKVVCERYPGEVYEIGHQKDALFFC